MQCTVEVKLFIRERKLDNVFFDNLLSHYWFGFHKLLEAFELSQLAQCAYEATALRRYMRFIDVVIIIIIMARRSHIFRVFYPAFSEHSTTQLLRVQLNKTLQRGTSVVRVGSMCKENPAVRKVSSVNNGQVSK